MQANNLDEQTITLESDDGRSYDCKILGVFDFDSKQYVLLLNLDESDADGEKESTVIMELIEKDDQAIFRTIESDDEFERVVSYIKEMASEMSEDDEEGEDEES